MPVQTDRRGLRGDPPGEVWVTVVAGPRDAAMRRRMVTWLAVLSVAVGSVVALAAFSAVGEGMVLLFGPGRLDGE